MSQQPEDYFIKGLNQRGECLDCGRSHFLHNCACGGVGSGSVAQCRGVLRIEKNLTGTHIGNCCICLRQDDEPCEGTYG
jgi:hypothetical protein